MKEISLQPYPGVVKVCRTKKEYQREHKKLFGDKDDLKWKVGRFSGKWSEEDMKPVYIVWAEDTLALAHELSHAVLHLFQIVEIDPREAAGEPFCYMLKFLLMEAENG